MIARHQMEAAAKPYYDQSLPYHNFSHATSAIRAGLNLVQQCRRKGIKVDEEVVYLALLWHDAGYSDDFSSFGSHEAYAADIAGRELARAGLQPSTIKEVKAAILATHRASKPRTREEMIVRIADISNVGRSYRTFMAENVKVRAEIEQSVGQQLDDDDWKKMSLKILNDYLTPNEINGEFIRRARMNLAKFSQ